MKLFYKSKKRNFSAVAEYINGKIIVQKGTSISRNIDNFRISKYALQIRENIEIVSNDFVLLRNVEFKSFSAASQFVSGASTNGMKVWKNKEGKCIKEIMKNEQRAEN